MDLSEEWKSQFAIGRDSNAPLLVSRSNQALKSVLGPLFFNPERHSQCRLLFVPRSFSPPLLSPFPHLSLPRFLSTSSPIPPSTASSITAQFASNECCNNAIPSLSHNGIQFLACRGKDAVLLFFAAGSNHDQVGFLVVSVEKSALLVKGSENGNVFVTKERFFSRIVRVLVNPVDDVVVSGNSLVTIGYVMAYTMYSVHWYSVKFSGCSDRPILYYLGFKLFKSCSIAGACWSPHLAEECLVLLESGALFLFVLDEKSQGHFRGTKLKVSWDDHSGFGDSAWLGCEFCWHPRIFIAARSDSVFLVDLRSEEFVTTCLAKIDNLSMYASSGKEQFLAFSRAGNDGFLFVLASQNLLFLCDVRRPLIPLLQWAHAIKNPCFIDFYKLSELRPTSEVGMFSWANEAGSCIILGSFWNSKFSVFCYGPSPPVNGQSVCLEVSKISSSLCAWELPSDLLLNSQCRCGSCILSEQFWEESLLEWIGWQQKKDMVLGFGVLNKYLSVSSSDSALSSGFTLIRLMSSGKLEAQRYCASWYLVSEVESAHEDSLHRFEGNLLYLTADDEYKFPRRFKYLSLSYLCAYLDGNLAEYMDSKMRVPSRVIDEKMFFSLEIHETLCEKLKVCGFGRDRTASAPLLVFNDISLPTSIFEIASRQAWAELPMELLVLAFSNYSEFLNVLVDDKKVSLEFLVVPDRPQLPPFFLRNPSCRSSKWTKKIQPCDALVGPVLPLPVLLILHEFRNGCLNSQEDPCGFSPEAEVSHRCSEILQVARDMAVMGNDSKDSEDRAVSLVDDGEDIWADTQKSKPFISYHPVSMECPSGGFSEGDSLYEDESLAMLISQVSGKQVFNEDTTENEGLKVFDDLCPIDLKFDDQSINFSSCATGLYDVFKKHFSLWQESLSPYQEFCAHCNIQKGV